MIITDEQEMIWGKRSMDYFKVLFKHLPIAVDVQSKAWTTTARLNAGVIG
jgi:hypothetical protein